LGLGDVACFGESEGVDVAGEVLELEVAEFGGEFWSCEGYLFAGYLHFG
jgi:hypothetical protein